MDDPTCALKLSAARCIVTKSCASDSLFVLLIALLTRLFVFRNQTQELLSHIVHDALGQRLRQVHIELAFTRWLFLFLAKANNRPTILGVFNVRDLLREFKHLTKVFLGFVQIVRLR